MKHTATSNAGVYLLIILAFTTLCPVLCWAGAAPKGSNKIYDESGNGEKLLADALATAKPDHRNVLVEFGGNWCSWCKTLHATFTGNETLSKVIDAEYVLTPIDSNSNEALATRLAPALESVPYLVVLDPDGKVIKRQDTEPFEIGSNAYDSQKLLAFLKESKPKPPAAKEVLDQALSQAKKQNKKVFLRFGASLYSASRYLDAFLVRPDMAAIFTIDYVSVRIDLDRMEGAKSVYDLYCKKPNTVPWFAVLDQDGKTLATSDAASGGNIGYPGDDAATKHFVGMLRSTAKAITSEQLTSVEKTLKQLAEEIKNTRPTGK